LERITTEEQLTALVGEPLKRVADKVRTRLGDLDRQWLAASPFWIATLALLVHVEEVFFHCSKAFLRSELWEPATWSPDDVPPRSQIAHALERPDEPIEVLEAYYAASYTDSLYRA
jgi:predicted pyridoxine 5'-phosphate oxidase superfamily flavin-nucleotide-binding protein